MIQHLFDKAAHVVVVTHVDPDGDALGSLTAVGQAFKQLGANVTLVCDDRVPERFMYLPMADQVKPYPQENVYYDLMVVVDCGDVGRMGDAYTDYPRPFPTIINIDHHVTNTRFGDFQRIDDQATSTTEILYDLFCELGIEITADIALSLLTGLVTDTLGFRTVGVTAKTMKIASELMDAGASLPFVTTNALTIRPLKTLELWRIGLNRLNLKNGLAWATITLEERASIEFRGQSSMGLVNLFADIDEVAMGAVLMEIEGGLIRIGLRCRPPFNVAEVAHQLGGGGHFLAAGCTLETSLAEAEEIVLTACQEAIQRQSVGQELRQPLAEVLAPVA
ncbi:MAG: bifunctional oligoribonuclease/PAP phosphatase NrnA [Chloroflexota bacterium]